MHVIDSQFATILDRFGLVDLDLHGETIFGLRPDLTLACFNQAWDEFARVNGAGEAFFENWGLGRSVLDTISHPLRDYFRQYYTHALATSTVWTHSYECSTADRYRLYQLLAYPLPDAGGLLVVNALIESHLHDPLERPAVAPDVKFFRDEFGLLRQCMHCRRFQSVRDNSQWDWVPDWVAAPPTNISHGLCEPCHAHYYKAV